jgi:hypothetical protein
MRVCRAKSKSRDTQSNSLVTARRLVPDDKFGVFSRSTPRVTLSCMTLTPEDLKEFQAIWKSVFQEEIGVEEASLIAAGVMQLYSLLARSARAESGAKNDKQINEVLPLLQEIDRKRGSAGAVD